MRISDWSSDVCSSDLHGVIEYRRHGAIEPPDRLEPEWIAAEQSNSTIILGQDAVLKLLRCIQPGIHPEAEMTRYLHQIGRASCRERVCQYGEISVVAVSLKKKKQDKTKKCTKK